jgi:hypothetical protein
MQAVGSLCVDACQDIGGAFGAQGWCNIDQAEPVRNWGSCGADDGTVTEIDLTPTQCVRETALFRTSF